MTRIEPSKNARALAIAGAVFFVVAVGLICQHPVQHGGLAVNVACALAVGAGMCARLAQEARRAAQKAGA